MNTARTGIPATLIDDICERLAAGKRIRRTLPRGGRLHIDRPLPFLCVHRQPCDGSDEGTGELLEGEASFLTVTSSPGMKRSVSELVTRLAVQNGNRFGAFLILEIWSSPDADVEQAASDDEMVPTELKPAFDLIPRTADGPRHAADTLRKHLERISYMKQRASVRVRSDRPAHPPGLSYLVTAAESRRHRIETLGLQIRPIYRDHATGEVFPKVLRSLQRGMGRAFKQAFFTFSKTQTTTNPAHYHSLGRRSMVKAVWDVDRQISDVADRFDFLMQVTPVNAEAAWREFRRSKYRETPRFYYRPLSVEPGVLKRELYRARIEQIEDPTLGELFRERQEELDRQITMLSDLGTPRFLLGSQQLYGNPSDELLAAAKTILKAVRPNRRSPPAQVDAAQLKMAAEQEIGYYRQQMPEFTAQAIIRDDLFTGLICSEGHLLIGKQTRVPAGRVAALLQHEVGTHLLTYYNGREQRFQLLHTGFAGYDAMQEGLAVLSEFLVGGLSHARMRILAARVLAANWLTEGASFLETFHALCDEFRFSRRVAYTLAMRIYRGGGLTKDAVYLRGLIEVLDYLHGGGELDCLFVGKMAATHIPLIKELQLRRVLDPPAIKPRYLEMPGVPGRLQWTRDQTSVLDLIKENLR